MSGVVIEQLFQDVQNSAYGPLLMASPVEARPRVHKSKKEFTKNSVRRVSAGSVRNAVSPGRPAEARSPAKDSSTTSENLSSVRFPIAFDLALSLYGNKLSPFEHNEIQDYRDIYFMGINATKIHVPKQGTPELFDDDEHYYQPTPHDHIAYRYEILDRPKLGKGTFSQVLKAFDHKEKHPVAIKVIRNERVYLKQSREELRILQTLRKQDAVSTQNIVRFFEFFMFRNHMCITFELLGMNLYEAMKKNGYKGLGQTKILAVARTTVKCLQLLYKNRIIHCDIKPENIMLKRNGDFTSVKLVDFGSSCYEQQQVYHYVQSRYYRAPEVILGLRYGPAIDMWSLGCVLGELSSGSPIFVGNDEFDQLAAIEEVIGKAPSVLMAKTKVKIKQSSTSTLSRGSPGSKPFSSVVHGDDLFKDFVNQMLEWDPSIRPSPSEIQEHEWIRTTAPSSRSSLTNSRMSLKKNIVLRDLKSS